ncbi:MAG: FAD-dependent oxidoreductase, partial [Gammaproteobacteria bacterium]
MTAPGTDPVSVSGKSVPVAETTKLLVIGAGPAGCTAAVEAVRRGMEVVLVDENPLDFETMSNDVPLHFGARMGAAVRNRRAMMEAFVAANPLIAQAYDSGVDVRLGTACWGLFLPTPTARWPGRPVAGLADGQRCWQIGFEHVIVATGCRDMGIAFPGWASPGVMGARAAQRLVNGYGTLDATRAVVLGSGPEALAAVDALK